MATVRRISNTPRVAPSAATARRTVSLGWLTAAVVFVAFTVTALLNTETGLHGDPRTTNTNPGGLPHPPFLGVSNWPLVTSVTSVVLTVGFFGYLAWQSIRRRGPHWLLIVGIAAFFAGALDPLANWATFAASIHESRTSRCHGTTSTHHHFSSRRCHSSVATRATTC